MRKGNCDHDPLRVVKGLGLPVYLWTGLKIRAARHQTAVRHVITAAIKDAGFAIGHDDKNWDRRRVGGQQA